MMTIPSTTDIEALIQRAYAGMPKADDWRLQQILRQLPAKKRIKPVKSGIRFAWIMGGLLTTAAAAWWTGDHFWPDQRNEEKVLTKNGNRSNMAPEKMPTEKHDQHNMTPEENDKNTQSERPVETKPELIYQNSN